MGDKVQWMIDQLQRAGSAERRREQELNAFFETASIGLHWVGPDGIIQWANQAELKMLGYSKEEYEGHHIAEFHADNEVIADIFTRLHRRERLKDYEARLRCKDGSIRYVLIDSTVLWEQGRFVHTQCFTRDITDQKRIEQELLSSEKRMRQVMSLMPAAVYTCDEAGRITYFNDHAVKLWGRAPKLNDEEEKYSGSIRIWGVDGSPIPRGEAPMALTVNTGKHIRNVEVMIERPDGSRIAAIANINPVYNEDGRLCGAISVFQDVTGIKQAEEDKRHLAAIIESSADAIISKDLNGIIRSWNHGAERVFGYTAEEVIGKPVTILVPLDRYDEESSSLARIRRGETVDRYDTIRRAKDGRLLDVSLRVSPIRDAEGKIVGASKIARNITQRKTTEAALQEATDALAKANEELERRVTDRTAELKQANAALHEQMEEQKRLQEQLRQSQKLESVGTLAGGIAHDFNNLLNIIKGYAGLIQQQIATPEEIPDSLAVIHETVNRGADVVRQLLTLARKTEAKLASTNANDVISELGNLLQETFPRTINIDVELEVNSPPILADPHQISQALLNLSVNARDAMPLGGKLSLRTKAVDGSKLKNREAKPEQYVCVELADTGTGMEAAIRERIFEPFFTTKGIGEGTGLGLSIVYGIVKNHMGFIDVKSEPGRGSLFRVYLPACRLEQTRSMDEMPDAKLAAPIVNGRGTILVVEDELAMVSLLRNDLRQSGYDVHVATDGEQAIELYRRLKNNIDVVLLDLGLPKISGWDVISMMKQENPSVKVIVASGYIEPAFKAKIAAAGVKVFVEKPYVHADLLQLIHSSLSEK
jgi:PAS domain S-box-containing protein